MFFITGIASAEGTTDFHPPQTNITIDGTYNNETGWYYDKAPIITFTATDDVSGVEHIIVQGAPFYNGDDCRRGECYLKSGQSIKAYKQTGFQKGMVKFNYFAKDKTGKLEEPHQVKIYVDAVKPELSILRIYTETDTNIPIGSNCTTEDHRSNKQCVIIDAMTGELITIELLPSDRISGTYKTSYRIPTIDKEWHLVTEGIPNKLITSIDKQGYYLMEIKTKDIAGNESTYKRFWLRITHGIDITNIASHFAALNTFQQVTVKQIWNGIVVGFDAYTHKLKNFFNISLNDTLGQ